MREKYPAHCGFCQRPFELCESEGTCVGARARKSYRECPDPWGDLQQCFKELRELIERMTDEELVMAEKELRKRFPHGFRG